MLWRESLFRGRLDGEPDALAYAFPPERVPSLFLGRLVELGLALLALWMSTLAAIFLIWGWGNLPNETLGVILFYIVNALSIGGVVTLVLAGHLHQSRSEADESALLLASRRQRWWIAVLRLGAKILVQERSPARLCNSLRSRRTHPVVDRLLASIEDRVAEQERLRTDTRVLLHAILDGDWEEKLVGYLVLKDRRREAARALLEAHETGGAEERYWLAALIAPVARSSWRYQRVLSNLRCAHCYDRWTVRKLALYPFRKMPYYACRTCATSDPPLNAAGATIAVLDHAFLETHALDGQRLRVSWFRVVGSDFASVRVERAGTPKLPGDGRVYHIGFAADDGEGGACQGNVTVCVPHDQRPGHACGDQGPLFDSTECAP